jgi:hypothetical protein
VGAGRDRCLSRLDGATRAPPLSLLSAIVTDHILACQGPFDGNGQPIAFGAGVYARVFIARDG